MLIYTNQSIIFQYKRNYNIILTISVEKECVDDN
jgi:hypothetical protein